jgi:predicted chitinase
VTKMDISKLKGQIPDGVYGEIQSVVDKFEMNTPIRLSHFLGQCAHESGNFKFKSENLNYSTKGLISNNQDWQRRMLEIQKGLHRGFMLIEWEMVQRELTMVGNFVAEDIFN